MTPVAPVTPVAPAVEARRLHRFFHTGDEEVIALTGVEVVLEAGELVALVGPSGSGKSTLLACLAGLDEPQGGTVRIAGEVMTRRPEVERAALRARLVGLVFQFHNLVDHLTVAQNLGLAQRLRGRRDRRAADELLERLGVGHRSRALPSQLSGGEAARVSLAAAVVNDPVVLVADEPTAEVDATAEAVMLELLADRAAAGTAVLVASHSRAVADAAHRVVTLDDGRVVS